MTKKSEVLTEKEARKYLGCSRNTFKNYVDTGVLEVIEIKKKKYSEILVKRTELHRFLDGKLIINEENKSKYLTGKEACELIKCSRNTFKSYVDTGALKVIKAKKKKRGKILVKRSELQKLG